MTWKAQTIKAKIDKWDFVKTTKKVSVQQRKDTVKREPTEWEKILANHFSDKRLISKIYKGIPAAQQHKSWWPDYKMDKVLE